MFDGFGDFYGGGIKNMANLLKYAFFYAVHEGVAEFFGDGDLFAADEDLVVADGFEAGDVDDVGVVDAGEGGGELFLDIFEAAVDE